jgi:hypothetical protein
MIELNLSMQGTGMNTIIAREKLPAFIRIFPVRMKCAKTRNFTKFPLLEERVVLKIEGPTIATEVTRHLR